MIVLYIILGILTFLLLILAVPAGAWIRYSSEGFILKVVYGFLKIQIVPAKKKKPKKEKKKKAPKPKKEKKPAKKKEAPKAPKPDEIPPRGGSLKDILEYLPVGKNLLAAIHRRLVLQKLVVLVNLAGDDPSDLAIQYGKANAILAGLLPILEASFNIKKRDMRVFCDFAADSTEIFAELEITANPIRLIGVVLRYGIQALKIFLKQRKNKKAVH